jgi:hypothetical protein
MEKTDDKNLGYCSTGATSNFESVQLYLCIDLYSVHFYLEHPSVSVTSHLQCVEAGVHRAMILVIRVHCARLSRVSAASRCCR